MALSKENYQLEEKHIVDFLLVDGLYSDVAFIVGKEGKVINAHKHILSLKNPVMADMLQGDPEEILESDVEPDVFILLLRCLYCREKCASRKTVVGLLYAAKKYQVQDLFDFCKTFLLSTLTEENVFEIMENVMKFDMTDIFLECMNFACGSSDRAKRLISSEGFLKCNRNLLAKLIQANNLPLEEILIFRSVVHWGEYNCRKINGKVHDATEIRNMLGDIIYHVRFPIMSYDTFWKMVLPTDILTDKEHVLITNYIAGNKKKCPGFNNVKRKGHRVRRFWERFKTFFGLELSVDHLNTKVFWKGDGVSIL